MKVYISPDEAWNGEWKCPACGESYIFSYYGGERTEPVYATGDVVCCHGPEGCGEKFEVIVVKEDEEK